ncbi:hypothetical protein CTAYLR_004187 [Chrysophaeum taylorii]|uniref:L-fucose mutarotase n=1 Tax=Chrysophaeum taylorii TaxID=2483200 RepID=A0AAD7XMC6_9STRA|nr:hypothetical protein CTAYLR_004187 [Chrysophaeum taylorii]
MGLLKGIDPLLSADLLYVLRLAGHGDKICVCDCNFPAFQVAQHTVSKKLVVVTTDLPTIVSAITTVLPVDFFAAPAAIYMAPQVGPMPPAGLEVIEAVQAVLPVEAVPCQRFDFYDIARECFAVVQTLERRPYGNLILTKGVVGPDGNDLKP